MNFDDVIEGRKSVRAFQNKKVNFRDLLSAVDSATKGPFAGNMNNLRFIIIEDNSTISKMASSANQAWVAEAQAMIVVCSNESDLEAKYDERGRVYSRQHAGAAIENLLLKLVDLGLSACWVGAFTDEEVRRILSIPDSFLIEALVPIGYERRDPNAKRAQKQIPDESVYWEAWNRRKRPGVFTGEPSAGAPPITNL